MKKLHLYLVMAILLLSVTMCNIQSEKDEPVQKVNINDFLGQWTLNIEGDMVGWLKVSQENKNNYLNADLLWKWGSVKPASNVYYATNSLVVTRTHKNRRGHVITNLLKVYKEKDSIISGHYLQPKVGGLGVDTTSFSGKLLPPVPEAPNLETLEYGDPVNLFNGKDLSGWKIMDEDKKNGWKAIEGTMVNDIKEDDNPREFANIRTKQEFEDFNLKLEVKVSEGSNSGIYLRGMYEIQVLDSYNKNLDSHHMGALYSRITPSQKAEKPAGTWQTMDITLCDRHVTVILNGKKIIDNKPVYGPTGGAIQSDVFEAGHLFFQGDHGKVSYRDIVLTPIAKK